MKREKSIQRIRVFAVVILCIFFFTSIAKGETKAPSSRYMGGPAELVTAPNGAIVNVGKDKIKKTLNAYLDGIAFTLDQTLRHILGGYGPDDLRHMIKMPEYLEEDPHNFQSYGELSFQTPAIYYHTVCGAS